MEELTTVSVTKKTRDALKELRIYPKEPMEELLKRLVQSHSHSEEKYIQEVKGDEKKCT